MAKTPEEQAFRSQSKCLATHYACIGSPPSTSNFRPPISPKMRTTFKGRAAQLKRAILGGRVIQALQRKLRDVPERDPTDGILA